MERKEKNQWRFKAFRRTALAAARKDPSLPPHAVDVIPPGQSGFVSLASMDAPHAYDQLPLYENWMYKPMRFRYGEILGVAESVMHLELPAHLQP